MATAKEISTTLAGRNIKFNRKFASIDSSAYPSEEARVLSEEMKEYLSRLIDHAINNEFTGEVKRAIDDITDMCVALTDRSLKTEKVSKLLKNYRADFDKIKAEIDLEHTGTLQFSDVVLKHLDREIDGLRYMIEEAKNNRYIDDAMRQRQIDRNNEEIRRLSSIREVVAGVHDNVSQDAYTIADSLINKLCEASVIIANQQDIGTSVSDIYDDALELAKKWRVCSIGSKKPAKDKLVFDETCDALAIVQSSILVRQRADEFTARLNEHEKRAEASRGKIDELEAQIREADEKITALNNEPKQDAFLVQSGQMTTQEFQRRVLAGRQEIERLEKRKTVWTRQIDDVQRAAGSRIAGIDLMRQIVEMLNAVADESLEKYYAVARKFDFTTLVNLLNGKRPTPEEQMSLTRMSSAIKKLQAEREMGTDTIETALEESEKYGVTEGKIGNGQTYAEEQRQKQQEADEFFAQFMSQMGGGPAPAPVEDEVLREDPNDLKNER